MAIGNAYVNIKPSFKGIHKETKKGLAGVETQFDETGRRSGGRFTRGMGRLAVAGTAAVGAAAAAGLGAALVKGFQRLTAIDEAEAKLRGLGHSAQTVEEIMTNSLNAVKGTAFGLDEAATVSAALVASGIKPGKELEGTLRTVADAATIAGIDFNEMGAIFGKVAASGRLQGDELNQLSERGIPALQLLSDHLGVTTDEVRKMVSKGQVDFETFAAAMDAGMGGAALKSGETFTGAWKNVGAALGRIGATLLAPFFEAAKGGMGTLTTLLDSINDALAPVMQAFGEWLNNLDWGAFGQMLAPLMEGFKALGPILLEAWKNLSPIGLAFEALKPSLPILAGALGQLAQTLGGLLGAALQALMPIIGQLVGVIGGVLLQVFQAIIPVVVQLVKFLGPVFGTALKVMAPLIGAVVQVVGSLVQALLPVVQIVMRLAMTLLPPLLGLFQALSPILVLVGNLFGFLVRIVGGILVGALNILTPILGWVAQLLGGVLVVAINILTGIINGLVWVVTNVLGPAFMWLYQNVVLPVWTAIKIAIGAVATWFQTYVAPVITAAINAVGAIFTWLYQNIALPVFNAIKWLITTWWAGVSIIFNAVVSFVKNYLAPVFQLLWAVVKVVWNGIKLAINAAWLFIKTYIFNPIVAFVRDQIQPRFNLLKDTVSTVWAAIRLAIDTAWKWIKKYVFSPIVAFVRDHIQPRFESLKTTVTNVWNGIKSSISTVWNFIRDKVFDPLTNAIKNTVPDAFEKGKDAIGKAWDKVKAVAKKPVEFVINTIINKGIIDNFNKIADTFNTKKMPRVKLPKGFDRGGWTGPGARLQPAGVVHADEFVVKKSSRKRFERQNPGVLDHINRTGNLPMFGGYAKGGKVGTLWDAAQWWIKKGARASRHSWFNGGKRITSGHSKNSYHYKDRAVDFNYGPGGQNATEMAFFDKWIGQFQKLFPGIRTIWRAKGHYNHLHIDTANGANMGAGSVSDGGGGLDFGIFTAPFEALKKKVAAGVEKFGAFGDLVGGGAKKMIGMPIQWIKDNMSKVSEFVGDVAENVKGGFTKGAAWGKGQAWATARGLSGAHRRNMNWIVSKESGWNPKAQNPRSTASGLPQFINSTSRQYLGGAPAKKYGVWDQLDGMRKYVHDRYGGWGGAVRFWKSHNYYDTGGRVQPTLYDNGGWLQPGFTSVLNATGKPEAVFTQDQLQMLSGGGGPRINVEQLTAFDMDDAVRQLHRYERQRELLAPVI